MYKRGFISAAPKEAEDVWNSVESRLPLALAAIDAGTLLEQPRQVTTTRDAVALHLIRSYGVEWTAKVAADRAAAKVRGEVLQNQKGDLAREFYRRHGVHPAGMEALRIIADELILEAKRAAEHPQEFWDRVKMHFQKGLDWLRPLELEISSPHPNAGEFVIGDSPALPLRHGSLVGGPRGGVSLDQATTVVMPFGPRHMVSLSRKEARIELDANQVAMLNRVQIINAVNEVCVRPSSGLEILVKKIRADIERS